MHGEAEGREERKEGQGAEPVVTREIAAEAAVWIARLHGPDRSRHLERECLAWQAQSSAHRLAFERCTDLWMDIAGVDRAAVARAAARAQQGPMQGAPEPARTKGAQVESAGLGRWLRSGPRVLAPAAVAAVALVSVLVTQQPWRDIDRYDTGIGEQRLVVLQDGTRLSLNTATRVSVELDPTQRRVSVESGEAFFEVAKDASRPFVVQAAGTEVRATGTAFAVRLMPAGEDSHNTLDVTLVEGQVVVRQAARRAETARGVPPVVMAAGERLRVQGTQSRGGAASTATHAQSQRDRPRLDQVLAWKRGEAVFDNNSLPEALAEMNRYSAMPIVADPSLAALRISGLYRTGDNAGFARAVAALHGLTVREHPEQLVLQPR